MKIETKFDLGQMVYCCDFKTHEFKKITCETCNGTGRIEIKKKNFSCVDCKGFKYKTTSEKIENIWIPFPRDGASKVWGINIKEKFISYNIDMNDVRESEIFASLEECQAECDRRNKEGVRPHWARRQAY